MSALPQSPEADLQALTRLYEVVNVCARAGSLVQHCLGEQLQAAVDLAGADAGLMQVIDRVTGVWDKPLHLGMDDATAGRIAPGGAHEQSPLRTALERGARVVVEDEAEQSDASTTVGVAVPLDDARRQAVMGAGFKAWVATPLVSGEGALIGVVTTYFRQPHHPTERDMRLSDLLVRQASDYLERRRHELALREADRRKDEFLATLAHELRNPLAPIRNGLHILNLAAGDRAASERVLPMLQRQVNHMVRLVDDLLEVSRISGGKVELRREHVDVAVVLQSAVETSRPLLDAARHRLSIELSGERLMVDADPVRLSQVISNLLNNAAKYTPDGGRIQVGAACEGSEVVVSVKDNGAGIAREMLPRVFDLFAQGESGYQRTQGGLGIGLTLVRSLVEMHGGSVEATSEGRGQGSVFTVRLPLAEPPVPNPQPVQLPGVPDRRRILILDDNVDAADSLRLLLELVGMDVRTVYDGTVGLQALDDFAPDLVLLDIGMPGMDGYEFARRARARPNGARAMLVAVSGWGQDEDYQHSRDAGIDRHLVKPVDLEALERILAEAP